MKCELSNLLVAFLCVLAHPALTRAQVRCDSGEENASEANGKSNEKNENETEPDGTRPNETERDWFTPSMIKPLRGYPKTVRRLLLIFQAAVA